MTVIQNEHPQTLALILSYASPDQASRIIENLPREIRTDVVERVAKMDRAVPGIVRIVEQVVGSKLDTSASEEMMEVGGLNYVADIMNNVDRSTEKDIFEELSLKDAPLADSVRKLMFVFEDIAFLDPMSIQRFIREVDSKDLAVALKATNQDVSNAIFSNMSSRMRDSIRTDIEYLHNIRMSDVLEMCIRDSERAFPAEADRKKRKCQAVCRASANSILFEQGCVLCNWDRYRRGTNLYGNLQAGRIDRIFQAVGGL